MGVGVGPTAGTNHPSYKWCRGRRQEAGPALLKSNLRNADLIHIQSVHGVPDALGKPSMLKESCLVNLTGSVLEQSLRRT